MTALVFMLVMLDIASMMAFLYNVDKIMDRDIKLDWDDLPSADMYSELLEEKVIQLLN